jgi:hypothetical protein
MMSEQDKVNDQATDTSDENTAQDQSEDVAKTDPSDTPSEDAPGEDEGSLEGADYAGELEGPVELPDPITQALEDKYPVLREHGTHNAAVTGLQTDASGGYDHSKL